MRETTSAWVVVAKSLTFLMRKVRTSPSVVFSSIWWPLRLTQRDMSSSAAGSSADTWMVWPACILSTAILTRKTGSGQKSPTASNVTSAMWVWRRPSLLKSTPGRNGNWPCAGRSAGSPPGSPVRTGMA